MGLARCIAGIAMLGACGGSSSSDAPWTVVAQDQPAALLSVWGSSETDVFVVGGDPHDGMGPLVEHYDGTKWTRLVTGENNVDLWWVNGVAGGPVFMSGSNGTILRYQNGTFEKMSTSAGSGIVFGLWAASATDAWAVGGSAGGGGGAFVWHFDGTQWKDQTLPQAVKDTGTCWKVNGRAANDVYISGTTGVTFHWNGSALEEQQIDTESSLFSVAGNSKGWTTVGGSFDGVVFENDGTGWKSNLPPGGPSLTGVAVSDDDAYAVGQFGTILRRQDGKWSTQKNTGTQQNLHAAWIDPTGDAWVVGGQFESSPTSMGVLLHKGDALQGSFQ